MYIKMGHISGTFYSSGNQTTVKAAKAHPEIARIQEIVSHPSEVMDSYI